ncbi:MAG: hypothetical protein Q8M26_16245 [Pseudolabrys sp.]|nr:hypothetical protein [Pseudolabrys sp.]
MADASNICAGGREVSTSGQSHRGDTPTTDPSEPMHPATSTAVASYVATMSNDLASMARKSGLDTLGYLLEMVRLEAESLMRHTGDGRR